MTPAATSKPVAPPSDPIRAALDDPGVRADLTRHAGAALVRHRRDLKASMRDELALEAVQETIERALRRQESYDAGRGTVPAWLHGILVKVLQNLDRKDARQPIQQPADGHAWEALATSLSNRADQVAAQTDATEYLSRLPADHRAILHMRYWQEYSSEEIADRLGITVGNARVRLCRALNEAKLVAGAIREGDGR